MILDVPFEKKERNVLKMTFYEETLPFSLSLKKTDIS